MATKAKPVPWEEVVDMAGDLFEWLVANGLAEGSEPHVAAAVRILTASPSDLVAAVANALVRVDVYRRADHLNDARTLFPGMPQATYELLFDYSIEQRAERDVRALAPRFAEIRRLIGKIEERKVRRAGPLSDSDVQHRQAKLDNVLASLHAVGNATQSLLENLRRFSPATTEYPLTFAGWKQFEKAIRAELAKLGFVWPS